MSEVVTARAFPSALDGAVASLARANTLAPNRLEILNDLAVAQLAVAERDQRLAPALRALDAIERVVARDSTYATALFNRALIRERLFLLASARRAWGAYLRVERDPEWRKEAIDHVRAINADTVGSLGAVVWDELLSHGHDSRIAPTAARHPQEGREAGYRKLGEWGEDMARGDTTAARSTLAAVVDIARGLDSIGGDQSVALAVRAIAKATGSRRETMALARGHVALARGTRDILTSAYEQAGTILPGARRDLERGRSAAAGWATLYQAWAHIGQGQLALADELLMPLVRSGREDQPALKGKAQWALGVTQVRRGNYELAERSHRAAMPFLAGAQEEENLAGISFVLTDALLLAGRGVAARSEELVGLRRLSRFPRSGYLVNHLTNAASLARMDGLNLAARAIRDEILLTPAAGAAPDIMAWTRRDRAEDLLSDGDSAAARGELEVARRWVEHMQPGVGADRVRADVELIAAEMLRRSNPEVARQMLDTVAATYRRLTMWVLLPSALRAQALASLQLADTGSAQRELAEAISLIERQSTTFESPDRRAAFQETAEGVFDEMVRLELDAGRSISALAYLERSRLAAWKLTVTDARDRPFDATSVAALPRRLPNRTALIDYAVLSDRVAIWFASDRAPGWGQISVPVTRDSVARLVALQRGHSQGDPARREFVQRVLFDLLVAPVWDVARSASRIAIIPDRELFQVPFAALRDPTSGQRLVERVVLATVPNATLAVAPPPRAGGTPLNAVIVVNAAAAETVTGYLPRLPGAADEASRIAPLYRDATLLTEPDRAKLMDALRSAAVFHFAGHAVFDIDQPELSYLLVHSSSNPVQLQAREIATLQLSNIQLAVLSACSSLSARATRSGAVAGLAYSFLAAGVPATVSTLWDVGDKSSANVMVGFHRGLVEGLSPPAALRRAQIAALQSGENEESWSAFIYSGPFTE